MFVNELLQLRALQPGKSRKRGKACSLWMHARALRTDKKYFGATRQKLKRCIDSILVNG
jgi:hypothetical protein